MNLATGLVIKPSNLQVPITTTSTTTSDHHHYNLMSSISQFNTTNIDKLSLKMITNNNSSNMIINPTQSSLLSKPNNKLHDTWMDFQGLKNWEGLLDPLDDGLRGEILRYGQFVDAAYRCFDFDTSSPGYATCKYPKESMLDDCGLGGAGYKVTKSLHATCGARLPGWTDDRVPSWASTRSSWIGYVAVCNDQNEIARLGRRDVVVAYRGTATCMEWLENLRVTLTNLPDDMARGDHQSMVQSGFLSLYTSKMGTRNSLQDSVRDEIGKILQKYADEPLSITVTGHSLGAALAVMTAHDIAATFKHAPLVTALSFGGPRIGNKNFRSQLENSGTKVLRIVNSDDPITKVPGFVLNEEGPQTAVRGEEQMGAAALLSWVQRRVEDTQWVYAEIGEELRLSSRDCPHLSSGGVATCHDLKTYLQLVDGFVSSNCPLRATAKRVLRRAQQEKQQILFG